MRDKTVGVRELKTHLSKYLKDVKRGGEIVVSERGKDIAMILPLKSLSEQSLIISALLKLSVEGKIILPFSLKKPSVLMGRKKVKGTPFSDGVIEDRR